MEMIKFKNKFHLSPEQSLFLGKKKWDENVYCGMKIENRKVTFPQVQTVLNGINVPNVQLEDIQAILNMRDASIPYLVQQKNISRYRDCPDCMGNVCLLLSHLLP